MFLNYKYILSCVQWHKQQRTKTDDSSTHVAEYQNIVPLDYHHMSGNTNCLIWQKCSVSCHDFQIRYINWLVMKILYNQARCGFDTQPAHTSGSHVSRKEPSDKMLTFPQCLSHASCTLWSCKCYFLPGHPSSSCEDSLTFCSFLTSI